MKVGGNVKNVDQNEAIPKYFDPNMRISQSLLSDVVNYNVYLDYALSSSLGTSVNSLKLSKIIELFTVSPGWQE